MLNPPSKISRGTARKLKEMFKGNHQGRLNGVHAGISEVQLSILSWVMGRLGVRVSSNGWQNGLCQAKNSCR